MFLAPALSRDCGRALAAALALGAGVCLALACGGPGRGAEESESLARSPIVTTERGARGGYLVFVDSRGARTASLTRPAEAGRVLDRSPAYSPEGEWIAFASTRGRESLAETSLWIVSAEPGSEPRRLTRASGVDRDPAWMPDGRSIVFSSNRSGSFDLYELPLSKSAEGAIEACGAAKPLLQGPEHALAPDVSPEGDRVVYMSLEDSTRAMSLWLLQSEGGTPTRLTEGPRDMTPTFSPEGDAIAFSAPAEGRADADLYLIDPGGGERRAVASEPLADQTGPAFSADGRHLFATAVYRSVANGEPVLSSLVVADLEREQGVLRALHDPVAVESRVGVTLGPSSLAPAALRENPRYADALRETIERELRRRKRRERKAPDDEGEDEGS